MGTSAIHVLDYLLGLGAFGIVRWVLNGIIEDLQAIGTQNLVTSYANHMWTFALLLYIVVGIFWLPRKIKELKGGIK